MVFFSLKRMVLGLVLFLVIVFFLFFQNASSPVPFSASSSLEGCVSLTHDVRIPLSVFESLPPVPPCFSSFVNAYHSSRLTDDFFFDSNYFLQPEFFPSFEEHGLSYWISPPSNVYAPVGVGAFRSESSVSISPSSPTRFRFFVFSSFGVRSFQGVRLIPTFLNSGDAEKVNVTLDVPPDHVVVVGPSFPKFHSAWVHPITVTVTPLVPLSSETIFVQFRTEALPTNFVLPPWVPEGAAFHSATDFVGTQPILTLALVPAEQDV